MSNVSYIFFGTSEFAASVLDEMSAAGFAPLLVVTKTDKPKGRGLQIVAPAAKVWADSHHVPTLQPEQFDAATLQKIKSFGADVFIVADYGKIVPETLLALPPHGVLNIHGSLLPKYRGASPIQSQILADDRHTGVTIILLDKELDHGPIIAKKEIPFENWPPSSDELHMRIAKESAKLLVSILPDYVGGSLKPVPQNEAEATFTKKIEKKDGEIDLAGDPYKNFLKYQAFSGWPGTFFFFSSGNKKIRVVIRKASYRDNTFVIERIVPEGKKETDYESWLKSVQSVS